MPVSMDQLAVSDFNNNNFNLMEGVADDSGRKFVKSQLFRKGIQSIKSDHKRRFDEIGKSMPNIYDIHDIDEEGDEKIFVYCRVEKD